jgi:hypothetical protein
VNENPFLDEEGQNTRLVGFVEMDYVYCLCVCRPGKSHTSFSIQGVIQRNMRIVIMSI